MALAWLTTSIWNITTNKYALKIFFFICCKAIPISFLTQVTKWRQLVFSSRFSLSCPAGLFVFSPWELQSGVCTWIFKTHCERFWHLKAAERKGTGESTFCLKCCTYSQFNGDNLHGKDWYFGIALGVVDRVLWGQRAVPLVGASHLNSMGTICMEKTGISVLL